jgi:hypothetical protein
VLGRGSSPGCRSQATPARRLGDQQRDGRRAVIRVDIKPPGPEDRGLGDVVELNGEKTWSFAPFAFCTGRAPCEVEYTIAFERIGRGSIYGPITVDWSIESVLRTFAAHAIPPGSEVIIDIAE